MGVRIAVRIPLWGIPCHEGWDMTGLLLLGFSACQVHLATSGLRPVPLQHLLLIALYSGQSTCIREYDHVWMRSIDVTILWAQKGWMVGSNGCVIVTVTFTVDVMVTADSCCNCCYQRYMTTLPLNFNCLCCSFNPFRERKFPW